LNEKLIEEDKNSYEEPLVIEKENKTKKILLIILAIIMILAFLPAGFYGGFLVFCGLVDVWPAIIGLVIIAAGITSCIFGIRILIKQWKR